MDPWHRRVVRPRIANRVGRRLLLAAERNLGAADLARLRSTLWSFRLYLYVTPGPEAVTAREPAELAAFHRVIGG